MVFRLFLNQTMVYHFPGDKFSRHCTALGIKHDKVTPYWPQANGEVERFNKPLEKAIQTAVLEGRVCRQEISCFLLQYRTTPHSKTKVAPCELLFNQVRGNLPIIDRNIIVDRHAEARENEKKSQAYHELYAAKRRHAKESTITAGEKSTCKTNA